MVILFYKYSPMDLPVLKELLTAIKDAVSGSRLNDSEVALPIFDPAKSDLGAESWCNNIETLAKEFGWSNVATVAKAGKALKGSALLWFETWDPAEGRSWDNLRLELVALYPEKKNSGRKAPEGKLQLIELVCGSICDVNVKMASFNSNVKTTSELIALFTSYAKTKKGRQSELVLTPVHINDVLINSLIDTGSSCSIIKQSIAERLGVHFHPCYISLCGIGKGTLKVFAKITAPVKGPYEIQSILPNDRYALKGNGNVRNIVVAKEKLRFWPGEWVDEDSAVEHAI
ncbi:hypothetical protein SFRURICE_006152 [Spodoptera frugiperda]|nr:hypothetical protein SFRURICE_006152 [Spodoptera frugiperda]